MYMPLKGKLITGVLVIFSLNSQAGEKASQKIIDFANSSLSSYSTNPVLGNAVKKQNSKGMSLDEIKAHDDKWKKTAGISSFMKPLMQNNCAKELGKIIAKYKFITEAFVMDNQGANVCMSDKTSDFWQGDEAKFKKSYASGKGAVFIDDVKFDKSTQSYAVQVSIPIKLSKKVIGAVTFGIDVDQFSK
jgi:hypothetical protein